MSTPQPPPVPQGPMGDDKSKNTMNKRVLAESLTLGAVGGMTALNLALMVFIVIMFIGLSGKVTLSGVLMLAIGGWVTWSMLSGAYCLWNKKNCTKASN